MKYLLIITFIISFLLTSMLYASEDCTQHTVSEEVKTLVNVVDEAPKFLKDAIIYVKTVNGKEHYFSANEFKVVRRLNQKVESKTVETTINSCVTRYKNRIGVLAGKGPKDSLDRQTYGNQVDVSNTQGDVFGVQYQRSLWNRWSLGLQFQTNKTGNAVLGYDY